MLLERHSNDLEYPTYPPSPRVSSMGRFALPLPSADTQEQKFSNGDVIGGTMEMEVMKAGRAILINLSH